MAPGVWNNATNKLYADGLGRAANVDRAIMESSSGYAFEKVEHTMDDTLKLVMMTTDSLRTELLKYQDAKCETAKELAIYGVQCVRSTLTLLKATLCDQSAWQALERRSAQLPTNWSNRCEFMKSLPVAKHIGRK